MEEDTYKWLKAFYEFNEKNLDDHSDYILESIVLNEDLFKNLTVKNAKNIIIKRKLIKLQKLNG